MGPLVALVRKEFIQFFRRRPLVVLVVWTIAIEIALCAWSITYDVRDVRLAIEDLDGSTESRALVDRFIRTEYFDAVAWTRRPGELDRWLEEGRATLGLVIPPTFSRDLARGLPGPVQLLVDGSSSNRALVALGYAVRIVRSYGREVELSRLPAAGALPQIRSQRRVWYNPELRSLDYEIIAMLTLGVLMIAIILPASGLAWEKEAGTIEQLMVMPFRPWELMLAKIVPTFVVSLGSLALALWLPWWFAVPVRGSLTLFFALSAVFLLAGLGFGLLIGTVAGNLQQALLLSFFSIIPVMVISGVLVPVESMPEAVQLLALASPLTYYLEIGLGIFLKGAGVAVLWRDALAMALLGAALFALGLWRFRHQIG
jgi:ABC-2 type transport system permease protein